MAVKSNKYVVFASSTQKPQFPSRLLVVGKEKIKGEVESQFIRITVLLTSSYKIYKTTVVAVPLLPAMKEAHITEMFYYLLGYLTYPNQE